MSRDYTKGAGSVGSTRRDQGALRPPRSLCRHMLFESWGRGGDRLARGGLVQGYAGSIVGKRDAVLFEGRLDPPVGLVADLELLARRCLHLAAEHLDPWIDAVELGLERLIDDLGELRVVQHVDPDLFHP